MAMSSLYRASADHWLRWLRWLRSPLPPVTFGLVVCSTSLRNNGAPHSWYVEYSPRQQHAGPTSQPYIVYLTGPSSPATPGISLVFFEFTLPTQSYRLLASFDFFCLCLLSFSFGWTGPVRYEAIHNLNKLGLTVNSFSSIVMQNSHHDLTGCLS
ncbi:hypothetical protein GGR50DRAFT_674787 [Xylaria sp. CBS 124048]|nr:hypothetical protein GGR50DRAFT_674787 [Xylaria sp. CBS 124048]